MDAYRLNVKIYADPTRELELERLIPIFHRIIQQGALDETWIDVADYKHVPDGPGVMLIAHEAHYGFDAADRAPGVLYARKRPAEGSFSERLRDAFGKTLRFARRLESEPELGLRFPGDRLAFSIQDRLLAPNNAATLAAVEPELRPLLAALYGEGGFVLTREEDAKAAFEVRVAAAAETGLDTLLDKLEAAPERAELAYA